MNGVSRGARLWSAPEGEPVAVIVLDKGPEGWWVSLEAHVGSNGHPRTLQVPARQIYPTKAATIAALQVRK